MKRNQAREIAVQLGFSVLSAGADPQQAVDDFFAPDHYATMADEGELYAEKPRGKNIAFITESVTGVAAHAQELDALIEKYAEGWRTERISRSAAAIFPSSERSFMPLMALFLPNSATSSGVVGVPNPVTPSISSTTAPIIAAITSCEMLMEPFSVCLVI